MNTEQIKIYHIVHIDRLASIIAKGGLFSDSEVRNQAIAGTTIGMTEIKQRRLEELTLSSHPGLHVGECVPFYFCPRSVMLYMFYRGNHPDISYHGGQEPIIHLVASLSNVINWAAQNAKKWAFTDSNAGSRYFQDYNNIANLNQIDWEAVEAAQWRGKQDKKQAEFLIERFFPWQLFEHIGVYDFNRKTLVDAMLSVAKHKPSVAVDRDWYY